MPAPSGPVRSGIFSTPAARITGVASRKENRAASSWDRPRARPATIVTPERLMPGSRARTCAEPIIVASAKPRAASRRSDARSVRAAWRAAVRVWLAGPAGPTGPAPSAALGTLTPAGVGRGDPPPPRQGKPLGVGENAAGGGGARTRPGTRLAP